MEIYRNRLWIVDEHGIESVPAEGSYFIPIDRVLETTDRRNVTFYNWPIHFAEKGWLDIALFLEAFEMAIRFHAEQAGLLIDEKMMTNSCREAHLVHQYETDFCGHGR